MLMLTRKAEAFLKINPIFLLFLGSRVEYCVFASELTEDAGWFAPATRRGGSISPYIYPNELQGKDDEGVDSEGVPRYEPPRASRMYSRIMWPCAAWWWEVSHSLCCLVVFECVAFSRGLFV